MLSGVISNLIIMINRICVIIVTHMTTDTKKNKNFCSLPGTEITRLKSKLRDTELQLQKLVEQFQSLNKGFIETATANQTTATTNCTCSDCAQSMDCEFEIDKEKNKTLDENIENIVQNDQTNHQTSKVSALEIMNKNNLTSEGLSFSNCCSVVLFFYFKFNSNKSA